MAGAISDQPNVGIVIINWNSFEVLCKCLAAIKKQTYAPKQVIVIDNNSDCAIDELDCATPENTRYIRLDENTGFAHANNLGVSELDECDYIALINPDAFLWPDWLEQMLSAAERRRDYSFFASVSVMSDNHEYLDGVGDIYHISGIGWRRGYGRRLSSTEITESEVFAPCAAAAMYSKAAWEDVGGFDEDFFCYFEDVDLAFRMRLMGYRCLLVPKAIAYHVGSVTSGGHRSNFSVYYGHRNLVWAYIKNMPGYAFWLFFPVHIIMNVLAIIRFIPTGQWRLVLSAKIDAINGLGKVWKKRHLIQSRRKIRVSDVVRYMDKRLVPIRRKKDGLFTRFSGLLPINVHETSAIPIIADHSAHAKYFDYLRSRGLLGLLYRKFWLYPRLAKNLSGRVLDIGCGIGDFLAYLPGTIGLDINRHAVEWCQKLGLDARVMEIDSLPFGNASFDGVVLDNVLEHLLDPRQLLDEIRRVLAPGGRLLIGVPGKRGYSADPDHKKFYSEEELIKTMSDHGFVCNKSFYLPFKCEFLDSFLPQYCLYCIFEIC